jgi:hypothetical protein
MGTAHKGAPNQDLRGNGIVHLTILRHGNPVSGVAEPQSQHMVPSLIAACYCATESYIF